MNGLRHHAGTVTTPRWNGLGDNMARAVIDNRAPPRRCKFATELGSRMGQQPAQPAACYGTGPGRKRTAASMTMAEGRFGKLLAAA